MAEVSQYQKRKQVADLLRTLDRGQRGMLLEDLLEDWAQTLPKRGKDYGATSSSKYGERLEWLQSHWGTQFPTKGTMALRRMPLAGVLELLTLFCLGAADSDSEPSFGSLEDGSELGDKVASALVAMQSAGGPQVVISQAAFNELQKIRREYEELGGASPEASTKVLKKLFDHLQAMPSVKDEKEVARYEKRKAASKKGVKA
jgi:hypothetical protein